ncbi:MAG: glutathione S-transferase [Oceanospirillaceae bacterium]|uniref:glutathione S-transferase family protein n=1 Tax=unclassified Thalassolituus TaxID=2624967 RepID=UPI000C5B4B8E|nr:MULTISPECIES: glutathione S-transferase family protein [unclassified Thalassolituus]MAS24111.1 glutathione S-transferase [Oceanospirillaceae bacterium]MAX97745.1 glutathione S-transferase [Oceanospirillaceae bacterium]MBL33899.1 glutathione S-transferase [Oceanospirillaceae bacterium]MBL34785.1 glutathione S-transferase [Oceanospirillaceae bacterium]MBS52859.1 glutathione S-transferase [Oceanospirillaceae bacterium]|tara:strand:- start:8732 stop:9349 length:618 start_codon:yes stop_codon:yes gene_type:complete
MKLYSAAKAPNPRRILMFLAEKGITDVEVVNLDLAAGDNLHEDFRAKNPLAKVPVLELDDGTCISECGAIYRYLEELKPEPALLGSDIKEKAIIEMWERRAEISFMSAVGQCFQHSTGFFKDRMTPIAVWGEESGQLARRFLPVLEAQLSNHAYLAGDEFSAADISAFCALEFAKVVGIRPDAEEFPALVSWQQKIKQRPSAAFM